MSYKTTNKQKKKLNEQIKQKLNKKDGIFMLVLGINSKQYPDLNVMILNFFFFFKAISSNCSETIIYSLYFSPYLSEIKFNLTFVRYSKSQNNETQ